MVIDAKTVLAFPSAPQGFETVAGQIKIDQRRYCVHSIELYLRLTLKPCEGVDPLSQCNSRVRLSLKLPIMD
jgi:hypothetical protein